MLTRITICLFLSFSLNAQHSDWQHYFHANYLLGLAETPQALWLVSSSSIYAIDKTNDAGELMYFDNAPLARNILDVYQEGPETVVVLSGHNQFSRWHAGQWSQETLEIPENITLNRIIGRRENGTYYLADYTTIYEWKEREDITPVPDIQAAGFTSKMDNKGWMWLWRYNRLIAFDADFNTMISQSEADNFINDLRVDEVTGNIWLLKSSTIDIWLAVEQRWESYPNDQLGFTGGSRMFSAKNNQVLLGGINQLFKLTYLEEGSLEIENIQGASNSIYLPAYGSFLDQQDKLWFLNGYNQELMHWTQEQGFSALPDNPWLPNSDIKSLSLDQQGKVWIAGWGLPSYFMGGRWHTLPALTNQDLNLQTWARDIVFTKQGYPVIGTGSLFSFGFPASELLVWNGIGWDTLQDPSFGNEFLLINNIKLDDDNNLWMVREGDEFFSLKSQGRWYHYKINDIPLEADHFLCLEKGHDGLMWIGTNKGLVSYDGFKFTAYDSTAINLGEGTVRDIAVDEAGNVWLSLADAGIRKFNGEQWEVILAADELPLYGRTNILATDGLGGVWTTVEQNGLMHYDGQNWKTFNTDNSPIVDDYPTNLIVDKQGRLWCSGYQSVSVYTPDQKLIQPFSLPTKQILAVFPNPGCCQFMVHWEAEQSGDYDFRLSNNLGQEVRRWSNPVNVSGEQRFTFWQQGLIPGFYVLQMSRQGQTIASQPLIISR